MADVTRRAAAASRPVGDCESDSEGEGEGEGEGEADPRSAADGGAGDGGHGDGDRGADAGHRGQLFLVAALALALLFVVLALLLNTAIFGENLASRSNDAETEAALGFHASVSDGVAGVVGRVNYRDNGTTYGPLERAYYRERHRWSNLTAVHHIAGGAAAVVENGTPAPTIRGTRVVQSDERNFTSAADADNWTVVPDAHVRNFTVEVNATSLTLEDTAVDTAAEYEQSDYLRIRFRDGPDRTVYLFRDDLTTDVHVAVQDGGSVTRCSAVSPGLDGYLTVNLSAGTVGDTRCSALDFLPDLGGAYDVQFWEAAVTGPLLPGTESSGTGTYSLVTNATYAGIDSADDTAIADSYAGGQPYKTTALYGVRLEVAYRSDRVVLSTSLQVVPGETDA